jgi:hypothetical protein
MRTWLVADGHCVIPQTEHNLVTESRARLLTARLSNEASSGLRRWRVAQNRQRKGRLF